MARVVKLYQALAASLAAYRRCSEDSEKADWKDRHRERIEALVKAHMPSGSGFDNGTTLDFDGAAGTLVFETSFHHMDEGGAYAGWTDHVVTVRPSLEHGFTLKISGRDRNEIKDLIHESFDFALKVLVPDGFVDQGPSYVVLARDDGALVLATREVFYTVERAQAYAATCSPSREPVVVPGDWHELRF